MTRRVVLCLLAVVCLCSSVSAEITFDTGTIAGSVTTTSGAPAPGSTVRATPANTPFGFSTYATVGLNGQYEMIGMPVGEYKLDLLYESAELQSTTVTVTQGATTTRNFTFAAGTISVHVTRNGADDAGALVFLQSADPAPTCTTPGAVCDGDPMAGFCNCQLDGRRYHCDPNMGCRWEMNAFYQFQTNASGIGKKLVPAGIYNVAVGSSNPPMPPPDPMMPPMMGMQSGFIIVGTENGVSVAADADVLATDVAYDTATVTGSVTAGGQPLTNVTIRAQVDQPIGGQITAWVDGVGTYTMQLPTNTYAISAMQDGMSSIGGVSNVTLTPGETRVIDFTVPGGTVSGTVVRDGVLAPWAGVFFQRQAPTCAQADSCDWIDQSGNACHGCTLGGERFMCMGGPIPMCFWENGGFSTTQTDMNGEFRKFLAPGTYSVAVMSAPVFGGPGPDPNMMQSQFGQVLVGQTTAVVTNGANASLGAFAYTTGTVSGNATSCGVPLNAQFELRNNTGSLFQETWTGAYSIRAPEGDYTLTARTNNADFASTTVSIAAATPATWSTNYDQGEVRGLVLRDGIPATFAQVFLQERTPTGLSCSAEACTLYDPMMGFCDFCTSNGRTYHCFPQWDPVTQTSVSRCTWNQQHFYQGNTNTDGFFTLTVAPGDYTLAVLSSSGGGGCMPHEPMCGPGGGQTGGVLVGTFDLSVAACRLTEVGLGGAVPVAGGTNQVVELGDGIELTFSDVEAGTARFIATSTPPPSEPVPDFKSAGLFYDIIVPAISGPVRICLPYDADTVTPDDDLHLYHNDNGDWVDITDPNGVDTVNHIVCGTTPSFSWFAVGIETTPPPSPLVIAGPSQVEADASCYGHAAVSVSGGTGNYEWFLGDTPLGSGSAITATLPLGDNTVRVVDGATTKSIAVHVIDTTAPTLSVSASPSSLWPPNGNMVAITPNATLDDNCDVSPSVTIVGATSPTATPSDIDVSASGISVRAFRAGNETSGRTYTLTYAAVDESGNRATATTSVVVPHDKR